MNSCVASCCTCFRTASYASDILDSWPTGDVLLPCLFAFSRSARPRRQNKTRHAPRTPVIFGSAPSVLDRWWSSRGSPLPRCNFVLHLWSPLPHETTSSNSNFSRVLARSVPYCLIAEQISSSGFLTHSLRNIFEQ